MPQDIDPTIKRLVSAIGQTETGASSPQAYTKRGASGEYGRYQFTPDTWNAVAPKYGVTTPLEQASIEEQNKVQYSRVKEWKDKGFTPAQIASMHNAGEGNPNAYKEGFSGVNQYGVRYDVPDYVRKVSAAYQGSQVPAQYQTEIEIPDNKTSGEGVSQETNNPTLGESLGRRTEQIDTAVGKTLAGEQGILSGVLQSAGALAGGLLDVGGAAVKAVPVVGDVVQAGEDALGAVANTIFDTEVGKNALESYQGWAQEHPEAAANIGAGANILSVIPIFKGVMSTASTVGSLKDAATKSALQTAAQKELEGAMMRTITGNRKLNNAKARGFDPVKVIIDNDALPDTVEDARGVARYQTANAEAKLDDIIEKLDGQLDAELAGATGKDLGGYIPMNSLRDSVVDEVKKELKGSPDMQRYLNRIEDDFDSFKLSYGDLLTLNEVNSIKRMVRKSVKFDTPDIDKNLRYHEGQVFMKVIEDVAKKRGLGNIRDLNRQMAERIEAEELLRRIANKSVAPERLGAIANNIDTGTALTVAGEAVGQSFGAPGIGAVAGRGISGLISRPKKSPVQRLTKSRTRKGIGKNKAGLLAVSLQGAERGRTKEDQE